MKQREAHTGEEIQAEVTRRVHESETIKDDGEALSIPLPQRLADGQPGPHASNWVMQTYSGNPSHAKWLADCVAKVQAEWDLQEGE